jgi:hypothetical protein
MPAIYIHLIPTKDSKQPARHWLHLALLAAICAQNPHRAVMPHFVVTICRAVTGSRI